MYGHYDSEHPVIVGLAGPAGSGKTSTAEGVIKSFGGLWGDQAPVVWDHLFHAMPLYEFASIRNRTLGEGAKDRQLHMIHDLLRELLRSNVSYDDMVELAYDIYSMPIRTDTKPREFLQNVGTILRAKAPDCFSEWIHSKTYQRFRDWQSFQDPELEGRPFIVLVSDVRLLNEAQKIKNHPNGILIRFDANETVLENRLFDRDKVKMTEEQMNHESEAVGKSEAFLSLVDYNIDTTNLVLEEQVKYTSDFIMDSIGMRTGKVSA